MMGEEAWAVGGADGLLWRGGLGGTGVTDETLQPVALAPVMVRAFGLVATAAHVARVTMARYEWAGVALLLRRQPASREGQPFRALPQAERCSAGRIPARMHPGVYYGA